MPLQPFAAALALLSVIQILSPAPAHAQWPKDQPIRIIVPQATGGTNDTVARVIAAEMGTLLGQSVVVENRPGAAGAIGTQAVIQAKPDGYTLGIASDSSALLNVVRPSLGWNFVRSVVGVGMIGEQPIAIAVPAGGPHTTLKDVIDAARARPGSIGFGSSGVGSSQHIVGEWLASLAKVKLTHVPYKGGGQAITDLVAGQIPLAVLGLAPLLPQQRNDKVRILAVTTAQRTAALPQVPTLTELGYPRIALAQFAGVVGPAGLPPEVLDRLSATLQTVLAKPQVQQKLADAGLQHVPMAAPAFTDYLKRTVATWSDLVPSLNLKFD
jgi:tripartite-type tricarboxylate transporter receptor subunit TctC